jgi:hypothetical protein
LAGLDIRFPAYRERGHLLPAQRMALLPARNSLLFVVPACSSFAFALFLVFLSRKEPISAGLDLWPSRHFQRGFRLDNSCFDIKAFAKDF